MKKVSTRIHSTAATTTEMNLVAKKRSSGPDTVQVQLPVGTPITVENAMRKTQSVDSPRKSVSAVTKMPPTRISRSPSFDGGGATSRPISIRTSAPIPMSVSSPGTKTLRSPMPESKSLYHTISPELLSVSPLRPSPSMNLLNRTAEVLFKGDRTGEMLRRMPVRTTTQVYEVRKAVSPGPSTRLARQESLLAVYKPATDEEDSLLVKAETSFRFNAEERALRERAAYVLDKVYEGFSHVPATALAHLADSKGSLQEFIKSNGTAEDNPALVGQASSEEVQRIAVLDCRIMNLDRHAGNVLVTLVTGIEREKSKSLDDESMFMFGEDLQHTEERVVKLTPIDHSLSLPPWRSLGEAWFDWTYWPQADEELTEATRAFVNGLNPARDERELLELGIRPECVATNHICTLALKTLVELTPHLTLGDLGQFFQRPYSAGHKLHHIPSPLEHLVEEACGRAKITRETDMPTAEFFEELEDILRERLSSGAWRSFVAV